MPKDLKCKTLRLKRGDTWVRTIGDLTAVVWRDKRDVGMLTNIHVPPSNGNFCDEHGNVIKQAIVADYNHHMGYVDKPARWPTAIRPAVEHGSRPKNSFSTC